MGPRTRERVNLNLGERDRETRAYNEGSLVLSNMFDCICV